MQSLQWKLADGTIYLNHGSFGPAPEVVQRYQRSLQEECNAQPMNFYLRRLEPLWYAARSSLAQWLHCEPDHLIFTENATVGMNQLAHFFPLQEGEEVLLNDHEYGVVKKIWKRRCDQVRANYREFTIPTPIENAESFLNRFQKELRPETKLVVVSHITSPTAITFPVAAMSRLCKERGIAICVDGPHAPLQIDLDISAIDPDFYIASCHKWLCAPLGTGFSYVAKKWHHDAASPMALSWGRLGHVQLEHWTDHYVWSGTRDYSGYLTIPVAIQAFEEAGVSAIRKRNQGLARYARRRLIEALGTSGLAPDDHDWYSMMAAVWLPSGDHSTLQRTLWDRFQIEVPIVHFSDRYLVRVSCHCYNNELEIDRLVDALNATIR